MNNKYLIGLATLFIGTNICGANLRGIQLSIQSNPIVHILLNKKVIASALFAYSLREMLKLDRIFHTLTTVNNRFSIASDDFSVIDTRSVDPKRFIETYTHFLGEKELKDNFEARIDISSMNKKFSRFLIISMLSGSYLLISSTPKFLKENIIRLFYISKEVNLCLSLILVYKFLVGIMDRLIL